MEAMVPGPMALLLRAPALCPSLLGLLTRPGLPSWAGPPVLCCCCCCCCGGGGWGGWGWGWGGGCWTVRSTVRGLEERAEAGW